MIIKITLYLHNILPSSYERKTANLSLAKSILQCESILPTTVKLLYNKLPFYEIFY